MYINRRNFIKQSVSLTMLPLITTFISNANSAQDDVKSIKGGCQTVVRRALGATGGLFAETCEAVIKADPKAAAGESAAQGREGCSIRAHRQRRGKGGGGAQGAGPTAGTPALAVRLSARRAQPRQARARRGVERRRHRPDRGEPP